MWSFVTEKPFSAFRLWHLGYLTITMKRALIKISDWFNLSAHLPLLHLNRRRVATTHTCPRYIQNLHTFPCHGCPSQLSDTNYAWIFSVFLAVRSIFLTQSDFLLNDYTLRLIYFNCKFPVQCVFGKDWSKLLWMRKIKSHFSLSLWVCLPLRHSN